MNRQIIIWPDSLLRKKAVDVENPLDPAVQQLLNDMEETMRAVKGAGLAAPQVGFNLRLIVLLVQEPNGNQSVMKLINPHVMETRTPYRTSTEGCLSLPGVKVEVPRPEWVRVLALDEKGEKVELSGDGPLALALQHEIDHLNGKVIADYLSPLKRQVVAKKLEKAKARGMRYVFPGPKPQDFTKPTEV